MVAGLANLLRSQSRSYRYSRYDALIKIAANQDFPLAAAKMFEEPVRPYMLSTVGRLFTEKAVTHD
jgi:hypothetical protein